MTDEQINQRIAEACGWTDIFLHPEFGLMGTPPNTPGLRTAVEFYTVDLNAMHEAEEFLSGNLWIGYVNDLANIEGNLFGIRATARQRAEAFLRTLGKWSATDKESLTVESTTEQSSAVHVGDTTEMVKEVQK